MGLCHEGAACRLSVQDWEEGAPGTIGPPTLEGIREGLREGMGVYPLSASQEEQNDGQKRKEGRSDGEAEGWEMGKAHKPHHSTPQSPRDLLDLILTPNPQSIALPCSALTPVATSKGLPPAKRGCRNAFCCGVLKYAQLLRSRESGTESGRRILCPQ
ncbi:hypothetical protein AOLI_G00297230 [Acnodon oligacanthus]